MTHPFGHIACWVDITPSGATALAVARGLWSEAGGRLSLLHGASGRTEDPAGLQERWRRLRGEDLPGAEPVFLTGEHGASACDWARLQDPDVIVIGADAGRLPGLEVGGLVDHLLEEAPCAVLVVPAPVRP
ncbi:MAG: universal stress protein [Thermoleophilia bacterium]